GLSTLARGCNELVCHANLQTLNSPQNRDQKFRSSISPRQKRRSEVWQTSDTSNDALKSHWFRSKKGSFDERSDQQRLSETHRQRTVPWRGAGKRSESKALVSSD